MLRIFAEALMIAARQSPMPKLHEPRAGQKSYERPADWAPPTQLRF